jgi:microcystin-dependent protein
MVSHERFFLASFHNAMEQSRHENNFALPFIGATFLIRASHDGDRTVDITVTNTITGEKYICSNNNCDISVFKGAKDSNSTLAAGTTNQNLTLKFNKLPGLQCMIQGPTEILPPQHASDEIRNLKNVIDILQGQIPVGTVWSFAGQNPPPGWLLCDGREVLKTIYLRLHLVIGEAYGVPTDPNKFKLPDLCGRTAIGTGQGTGLTNRNLGDKGGLERITLTANEMPTHTHEDHGHSHNWREGVGVCADGHAQYAGFPQVLTSPGQNIWTRNNVQSGKANLAPSGGNQPHDNMQPFLALNFIIKH